MYRVLLAVVSACGLAACGVTNPSDLATVTFSGTVDPGSQSTQFSVRQAKTGEFVVKVTAVAPDSGATLLFEYGGAATVGGVAGCSVSGGFPVQQNKSTNIQLPAGDYCVFMADPGSPPLPKTESFTMVLSHT
jgi:hypothetical protein